MRIKIITSLFVLIALILLISNYINNKTTYSNTHKITKIDIEEYKTYPKNDILKTKLLQQLLKDSSNEDFYADTEIINLKIMDNVIIDNKNNTLFVVSTPNKSLLLVYSNINSEYNYLAKVDSFINLLDVQIMDLNSSNSIILVREHVNQLLSSFEQGTYVRGYTWQNNTFKQVLSIVESYSAYYNTRWNKEVDRKNSIWERVTSTSKMEWKTNEFLYLNVLYMQNYAYSIYKNTITMPDDSEFEVTKNRDISVKYYWSDAYSSFIMDTATYLKTGATVAILENLHLTPFAIVDDFINEQDKYIVKDINGNIFRVYKNELILK